MSRTPRTDARDKELDAENCTDAHAYGLMTDFARQLEKELVAEKAIPSNMLSYRIISQQRDIATKALTVERAMADRLARHLDGALALLARKGVESPVALEAVSAWKELRTCKKEPTR